MRKKQKKIIRKFRTIRSVLRKISLVSHCVKSARIRSFSGPHFPAFGLNREYCPYLFQMQEDADRKISEYKHLPHSVLLMVNSLDFRKSNEINLSF